MFYNLLNKDIETAGVIGISGVNSKFISGAGMLFSNKICKSLVENQHKLDYGGVDDVVIGLFLAKQNVNIIPFTRFEAYKYHESQITKELINSYYHFRCKTHDEPRCVILMKKIISIIYNIQ